MESLKKGTLKTARGYTYTYYASPAKGGKPTVLLLHGWPDDAALWEGLMTNYLVPAGYGVVAPDCLGYAGTDKPLDPSQYNFKGQTADVCEILDKEGIEKVIPLGHDWGAAFAARVYVYAPERCVGLITLNVAFMGQSTQAMNLDASAKAMEAAIGYFPMWYWYLFGNAVEGPEIVGAHIDSMFTAAHGEPKALKDIWCKKDGLKEWLLEDKSQPVQPYATDAMRKQFKERLGKDGFAAPLMWYRALLEGHQSTEEAKLAAERFTVDVPYLFVAGLGDVVCLPGAIQGPQQAGLLPKLTTKEIDSGHWCMLSHPKETGEAVVSWLDATY